MLYYFIQVFAQELHDIVGNVLIAAACVAYLGVFTSNYREELSQMWVNEAKQLKIPASPVFRFLFFYILVKPTYNTMIIIIIILGVGNSFIIRFTLRSNTCQFMVHPEEDYRGWLCMYTETVLIRCIGETILITVTCF